MSWPAWRSFALGLAGLLASALLTVPGAEAAVIPGRPAVPAEAGLANANQRVAEDQARAATISAQIQSKGLLLAKYAERADAESVRSAQLDVRLRATGRAAASATREVLSTRSLLVAQAVAAYTNGGAFSYGPGAVQGSGLVVAAAYAEAVAQRQQLALRNYRGALTKDQAVFSDLSKQKASVRTATRLLAADRAAASAEQSSLRRTLGGVKGDLALAVADVERQQAAVQAEEEKALLQSLKQLPKPTQVMAAQRLPSAGGASARAGADVPASSGTGDEPTTAAPAPTTTPVTEREVPLAAVTTAVTAAPTTTTEAPTTTVPSTATTSAGTSSTPEPTSSSTAILSPTTAATTAPPSTTSTTETSLTSATTSTTAATSLVYSSSTSASSTTTPPTSLSTTTTASPSAEEMASPTTTVAEPTSLPALTTSTTAAASAADSGLPASGWQVAMAFAESQIGKPYRWGGAGPATYDCSGLTMVAWAKAGVSMPHSAQDQYNMTARIPLSDLQPGDLVFFGTPTDVYHVGMYVGGGSMVDAPETGQDVMIQPIYELNLLGGGRPA